MQRNCKDGSVREKLIELRECGNLKFLHDKGFLGWKIFLYLDVCDEYDLSIKCGDSKMDAVYKTALRFNIDIATVYRILNKLEYESRSSDPNAENKE